MLTTGRMLFQYHTGSMTRRSKAIEAVAGTPYVEMNGLDASRLSVVSGTGSRSGPGAGRSRWR